MIKYEDQTEEVKLQLRKSYQSVDLLRKFGNKANLNYFFKVFGEGENTERLWINFVQDCNRDIYKFQTYLTQEQLGDLYANIHFNEELYIK